MHLDKIIISTNDLVAVHSFYEELLGFPVKRASEDQIVIQVGSSEICFIKGTVASFYHFAFLIPANQLVQALNWVEAKTPVLPFNERDAIADFKNWNAQAFYFHDYAQNILEFIVHHDLQNDSDTPFVATSILSVCEIGIPVASVTDACHYFHQQHQFPYYKKGPKMHDFAVMGDEDGLLIVTTIGRGWLPTGRPAEKHPLEVQISHNGATIQLTTHDFEQ
jgi:catechol 2,3-dioxygenase-like lactoylglutathione lyase family enzyme